MNGAFGKNHHQAVEPRWRSVTSITEHAQIQVPEWGIISATVTSVDIVRGGTLWLIGWDAGNGVTGCLKVPLGGMVALTPDRGQLEAELEIVEQTAADLRYRVGAMTRGDWDPADLRGPDFTEDEAARDLDWNLGRRDELTEALRRLDAEQPQVLAVAA